MRYLLILMLLATSLTAQTKYKTKSYILHTTADKKVVRETIIPTLDRTNKFLSTELKKTFGIKIKSSVKDHVHVYVGLEEYKAKTGRNGFTSGGYIVSLNGSKSSKTLHLCLDPKTIQPFEEIVLHESTHLLMYTSLRDSGLGLPTWLHEGIAVYFEGYRYNKKTKKIEYNPKAHDRRIKIGKSVADKGLKYFQINKVMNPSQYGAAYLYVKFILSNKKRTKEMKKAISKSREDKPYDKLFKVLKTDEANFIQFAKTF